MKKDWTPTESSLQQFLHWLDEGVDSGGQRYLEMRRRLVAYFDRKNCLSADELADETLSRVAQKLQEKGSITGMAPAQYCYVTAKFVFLEYVRQVKHGEAGLAEFSTSGRPGSATIAGPQAGVAPSDKETLLACLDRCLKQLPPAESELILEYYQGELKEKIQRRRQLGIRLGLSANALNIRACRIRARIEECVRTCREDG